jgi:hypothetical protein
MNIYRHDSLQYRSFFHLARSVLSRKEIAMAVKRKAEAEQNAHRVVQWLADNEAEFGQEGIYEERVAPAVGLAELAAKEAVDYLENREEVVRIPKALTPPKFLLKPGRGWSIIRDKVIGKNAK